MRFARHIIAAILVVCVLGASVPDAGCASEPDGCAAEACDSGCTECFACACCSAGQFTASAATLFERAETVACGLAEAAPTKRDAPDPNRIFHVPKLLPL